jgi:hypothetical protein
VIKNPPLKAVQPARNIIFMFLLLDFNLDSIHLGLVVYLSSK